MCDTNESEEHEIVDEWLETLGELEEAERDEETDDVDATPLVAAATEVRQACR